jgi:hypothetical protein
MLSRVTKSNASSEEIIVEEKEVEMSSYFSPEVEDDYANDITGCPLTQFAVVYAALIHDVDHAGVSNDQLIKEGARIAKIYNNKSVAENHSFHLAFEYLMQPEFENLVACICGGENSQVELQRFSSVLHNAVLATDVFDRELKADRDSRWASVFGDSSTFDEQDGLSHRRAQIVLEHLIQTSDIIHTMQHVSNSSSPSESLESQFLFISLIWFRFVTTSFTFSMYSGIFTESGMNASFRKCMKLSKLAG